MELKRLFFTLFVVTLTSLSSFAQHSIQSSVFDAKNGMAIEMATVRLLKQADSTLVQGAQTNEKGGFVLPRVKPGNYVLVISSIGYNEIKRNVTVQNKDLIMKNFQMNENVKLLKEVEVKGTAAQLVVKGDTLEYNATAFKTAENAVVEELIKKLPGAEISTDGKITINGEEIKKIRIDGKKFFDGDIEQATKNLPADMIEKIQVLDQKSDMAQLTGFEDGDTERIINLTTKSNRRTGVFGNVAGSAGADINKDFRYDGNLSLNLMNKDAQTSINAAANNLNNTRSSRGRGSWGGGSNSGITESQNLAVNNNTIIGDKVKIGGDASFNHANNLNDNESKRTSYLSDATYDDNSKTISSNDKYDINMRLETEIKFDTLNTLVIQPNFNYNITDSRSVREYSYLTENDSTSWGNSENWGTSSSVSGGLNLIYNKKITSKKGRNLTVNLGFDFSQSDNESFNISNKYTDLTTDNINQRTNNESNRFSSNLRLSFVEPLWNNKNMLEFALSATATTTTSEKKQYGIDENDKYTLYNEEYSNTFENMFYRETAEVNYRYSDANYKITLGVNAEPSQTHNIRTYGDGYVRDTTYGVFNFSPNARLQYNFGKKEFARIDYRGRTQQPSIDQMQPVKNNSDLMSEVVGNPLLDPAFNHTLRLMYSRFNDKTFSSFNTFLNFTATKDALVSNKIYDETLKQYNQTVNADVVPLNLNWNVMYTTPIIQKRLHFSTNTNTGYRTQYSYTSRGVDIDDIEIDHLMLGDLNKTRNYTASEELSLTFTHDVIEIGVRGNLGYSNALNNQKNVVTEVWNWTGRGNMVIRFPYNFVLSSDIAYSDRAGYSNFDQSEILWNASLDKTFKRATLSLKANDILRQRLNIRQNVGDNYIQYNSYNTLPSYFLVSFSYRLNKFGGNRSNNNAGPNFGPGGGGGGGFRRGGMGGDMF
jgi:hypothetical protein